MLRFSCNKKTKAISGIIIHGTQNTEHSILKTLDFLYMFGKKIVKRITFTRFYMSNLFIDMADSLEEEEEIRRPIAIFSPREIK